MINKMLVSAFVCIAMTNCANKDQIKPNDVSFFPNTVGLNYNYLLKDSTAKKSYNVLVSTKGIVKMPNGQSATLWEYKYPDHLDSNYVVSSSDSAVVYDKSKKYLLSKYYFPLTIGRKWSIGLRRDSVISNNPTVVLNETMNNVYQIGEMASAGEMNVSNIIQFSPNIGIVSRDTHTGGIVFNTTSWTLVSFSKN